MIALHFWNCLTVLAIACAADLPELEEVSNACSAVKVT